jgi:Flp pilus assembly protein TadG
MTSQRITDRLLRLRDARRIMRSAGTKSQFALNEDGGAMVEFTIMAPMFFLLVFGMIEWGSIYWLENNMVYAAREGARTFAVQNATIASTNATTCKALSGTGQQFTVSTTDLCPGLQDVRVSVSVAGDKASLFNWLGMFTGVTFSSSASMRREITCPAASTGTATCTCNTSVSPPTCS